MAYLQELGKMFVGFTCVCNCCVAIPALPAQLLLSYCCDRPNNGSMMVLKIIVLVIQERVKTLRVMISEFKGHLQCI